ncbi:hypothetical protein CPB83DRAFT_608963 [Crepidotus variabilis]|uniref:F-box domain-containing protein n=1 Tax=Crepidotus variabilis TaxID=179855 RepID=A0A9P6E8H2_9AGAR|nr:hypothetical protein CPB83DRAFT_608963 [Crepidotus variabilis]
MHAQELPFDILERVFLSCVTLDQAAPQPAPYCAPISLCHVSQWWRKVAMDSPRLWERLTLEVETFRVPFRGFQGKRYIYPKTAEFSDWWWANAKKRPLALSIREPEMPEELETTRDTPSKPKALPKIKPSALISIGTFLLSPMIVSARSLHVAHGHLDNLRILCNPHAELPNLQCLTLSDLLDIYGSRITYSTLAKAPLLRYVHLAFYDTSFTFPYNQLTHLFVSARMSCYSLRVFLTQECPNLIVGAFDIGKPTHYDLQGSPMKELIEDGFSFFNGFTTVTIRGRG